MTAPTLASLKVKLFTDGADKAQIVEMAKQTWIAGFTTNPSLLKKAGVSVEMHLYPHGGHAFGLRPHEVCDYGMAAIGGEVVEDDWNDFGVSRRHLTFERQQLKQRK